MSQSHKVGLTLFICSIMVLSSISNVYAQKASFSEFNLKELEYGSSRLTYKISDEGKRYVSYVHGPLFTTQEPDGNLYKASHSFKFADITLTEYENRSINIDEFEFESENVTNRNVFPYHYNFQIDSQGIIHTAYISDYTLYYAARINGTWQETRLSNSSRWWALQPDITLGENDLPRIVYTVIYKENAKDFFDAGVKSSARSVHYMVFNGSSIQDQSPEDWLEFDVNDNHGAFADGPNVSLIYNPTVIIHEGKALIAYNDVRSLGAKSRIIFMAITEIPISEAINNTFSEFTYTEIYSATLIATRFRRPSIFIVDQQVMIAYSSWETGGAIVSILSDVNELPNPDIYEQPLQWNNKELDLERRNFQIESITGVLDPATKEVILTWSVYDLFNEGEGLFDYDVFSSTLSIIDGEFDNVAFSRVTNTVKTEHLYPAIALNEHGEIEIAYIIHGLQDSSPFEFAIGKISVLIKTQKGGEWGFALALSSMVLLVSGWYFFVNKVIPVPEEEEEELMPHMINLKDSITKD